MKKTLIATCMLLTSCGLMPTRFDPVEYNNVVNLSYMSERVGAMCDDRNIAGLLAQLQIHSGVTTKYITNTKENSELKDAILAVDKQINELTKAYTAERQPSVAYCQTKFAIVNKELSQILTTVGGKLR